MFTIARGVSYASASAKTALYSVSGAPRLAPGRVAPAWATTVLLKRLHQALRRDFCPATKAGVEIEAITPPALAQKVTVADISWRVDLVSVKRAFLDHRGKVRWRVFRQPRLILGDVLV